MSFFSSAIAGLFLCEADAVCLRLLGFEDFFGKFGLMILKRAARVLATSVLVATQRRTLCQLYD